MEVVPSRRMHGSAAFHVLVAILLCAGTLHAQAIGWAIQSSPTTQDLFGVACSDSTTWIAVGNAGTVVRSTNGGVDWTVISVPAADDLRSVSFNGSVGIAVGFAGRVLRTTDGGLNWSSVTRPTTRALLSSSMSHQMAVIGGEEGQLFVSTDNGVHWNLHLAGTAASVLSLSVDGDLGFGSGGQGTIWLSGALGAVWVSMPVSSLSVLFYGISFPTTRIGWTVGTSPEQASIIARSNSGGVTWTSQSAPSNQSLFGVAAVDTSLVFAVGSSGTIIHTTDGGNAWDLQQSGTVQTLYSVSFANPRLGIAVGTGGVILRTTTGGLTGVKEHANEELHIPERFRLEQNYPNPFNPTTRIEFSIPQKGFASLKLYDLLGREVAILLNQVTEPGSHEVVLDGRGLSSGVYFYQLEVEDHSGNRAFRAARKLTLLR